MKAVLLTHADRVRQLDKQGLESLKMMQRKMVKNGDTEKEILKATDEYLRRRGIGEYKLH